jgi:uncharacterized membrane protein
VLGVIVLYSEINPVLLILAFLLALLLGLIARDHAAQEATLKSSIRRANALFQIWYLVPFAWIALAAAITTKVALTLPELLATGELDGKVVAGVLLGALNALVAAAWLDHAKDPNSALWPDEQFRKALREAFANEPRVEVNNGNNDLNKVVFDDDIPSKRISGWTWAARYSRAIFIETEMKRPT